MSDDKLLRGLWKLLSDSRRDEAGLIAYIAEVDARKLYAREAASSMFAYCTEVLHQSEPEAALRIRVARTSRRHPVVLTMLREGQIHLSGIALLAPVLTRANRVALLKRATHKTKRQIEEIVAELAPRPDIAGTMRKLPARRPEPLTGSGSGQPSARPTSVSLDGAGTSGTQQRPDAVTAASRCTADTSQTELSSLEAAVAEPHESASPTASRSEPRATCAAAVEALSPGRYGVRFTASAALHEKLERLRALMRRSVPDGDLAQIIEIAVTRELERLEARRFGKTTTPRTRVGEVDTKPKSRYIPAAVRRVVEARDGGRCTYRDKHGRRCTKRHDLEFHHLRPYARGGPHAPENLALACSTHNALLAEQDYGKEVMERFSRSASRVSEPLVGYGIPRARATPTDASKPGAPAG